MNEKDERLKDKPLTRPEASRISRWLLQQKGIQVPGGWTGIHKLTPAQIARQYKVKVDEIIEEARLSIDVKAQA